MSEKLLHVLFPRIFILTQFFYKNEKKRESSQVGMGQYQKKRAQGKFKREGSKKAGYI